VPRWTVVDGVNTKRGCVLGCLGFLALPFLLVFIISGAWLFPFPARQVAWEHRLTLPGSARVVSRENSGIWWMDAHARATITIAESDAPAFVEQLKTYARPKLTGIWTRQGGGDFSGYDGHRLTVTLAPAAQGQVQVMITTITDEFSLTKKRVHDL
jgi:hypothetical protein